MIKWQVKLSNGQEAIEHEGEWVEKPNEGLPWRRLCEYSAENEFHLLSVDLDINGKLVHLPFDTGKRFGLERLVPQYYSIQYCLEVDNILVAPKGATFVNVAAHYDFSPYKAAFGPDNIAVHYIHNVETDEAWICLSEDYEPMVPSPKKQ